MGFWEMTAWAGLFIWACVTLLWLLSVALRNVSIVDIFWGMGFVLANGLYFLLGAGDPSRKALLLVLVSLWGLRLTVYLAWRNVGKGEDFRYQQFRQTYGPARYWWISYFQVFLLQGVLMWLIAMPLAAGMQLLPDGAATSTFELWHSGKHIAQGLQVADYVGMGIWAIGFFFESVGDWQLARFKANPARKGEVMDRGLWRYTRHPNYFGDAAVWWGYGLIAIAAGGYWAALGALLITGLIVKVSGVALLERSLKTQKPAYAEYIRKTSAFFPWFPRK
jgi:steroid 5-alpha reductase family enzyme